MHSLQRIVLMWFFTIVSASNREAYLDKFCKEQIHDSYLVHEHPKNEEEPGKPVKVFIKFKVIDIDEIDGANMDFRLHMYFKTFWNDTRLKRNSSLTTDCSAYVWTPDLMFETAKTTQNFDTVSTSFRIEPSGLVLMTDRYSFKARCVMDFRKYPFDTQQCLFSVGFMTTSDRTALLKWLDDESSPFRSEAIELSRVIEPLQYRLEDPTTHAVKLQLTYANYTYLVANFTLVRRLTGSIVGIYLPSALVVSISWVTFWLRPEAAPARVSLSITSLLTLCTQVQQYKSQLPSVNYITAMDIWLFVCIFEVFATLLEFAICYNAYVGYKDEQNMKAKKMKDREQPKSHSSSQETKINSWTEDKKEGAAALRARIKDALFGREQRKLCLCSIRLKDGLKMDTFCRKYFPLSFLAFAVVYWIYYLSV